MSPRSSDEYLEVLPLLASGTSSVSDSDNDGIINVADDIAGRVVIAFDIPGYGASENPPRSCTIDELSDAFLTAADSILAENTFNGDKDERSGVSSSRNYIAIGSLLGNYFCVSLASRYPERIKAGILTNPWFNPAASGSSSPSVSDFELKDDGSHLTDLHSKRSRWLDPDLNFRVVSSEISYLANRRIRYRKGISIEGGNEYDFTGVARKIVEVRSESNSKFLCILGESCATTFDKIGIDGTRRFDEACKLLLGDTGKVSPGSGNNNVRVEWLKEEKSTLNVINQMPEEFAALCNDFLFEHGL
jgi:hypothetical protein